MTCESCGRPAKVRLSDGSTWCGSCHGAALDAGYDEDLGTIIDTKEATDGSE